MRSSAVGAGASTEPPPASPGGTATRALPELRWVSVLFVDLVGFTSLSDGRDAEDVREVLGWYFESARTIVGRYAGSIEKFIGDAVMAVWGAPVAKEDDAERAVRAALEIVDAVGMLGEKVGISELRARAGVVTGQVAAIENPGEALVVGDRVNTASRVQSAAQPGSVFVDEVTRQVTMAAVAYEHVGEHQLKGKAEPLTLWRAVRVVAGRGGSRAEGGLEVPFVGREPDSRLVKGLFHAALERRSARLVAVSGQAGVGKSRLRSEFANYVDGLADTVLWHVGRCLSYGDGVAYWALAEMVRLRLGIREEAGGEEAAARLREGLERWVTDPQDRSFIWPRLGALLGVAEPGMDRDELFAGWRLFFERLAAHEPVALVFEDLQWADVGLLDFIEHLLDWSADSPIFMLTLGRPEIAAASAGWPSGHRGATVVHLEPLSDQAMRDLLAGIVDGLPDRAAERIVQQAQGVPLFAIETVRALADSGVLISRDGRLVAMTELDELSVPASLGSLLTARLDALEPAERRLLKAMSVFGGAFPRSTAAALGDIPEEQLDGVLASLVRKEVLVIRADPLSPDRGQYAFAQGLLRTVAYEMLSRQERKPRHRAAAEHLRAMFANDGEEVAELIASHYVDAYRAARGDPDSDELRAESVAALQRAAHRAAHVGAPSSAETAYRTAIELAADERERAELMRGAGEMALESGRTEEALRLLEAASAAHLAAGRERDAARIAGHIGRATGRLGRNREAAERIAAALKVLGADRMDAEVAELNAAMSRSLVLSGQLERATPSLECALKVAEALGLPSVLSYALNAKASMYARQGRAVEARLLYRGAIEIAERHGLIESLQRAQANSGDLCVQSDLPEAAEQLETALALARRRGNRYWESITCSNLMQVHLLKGRWDEVERLGLELLDSEKRPSAQDIHYRLASLHLLRGELDAARTCVERLAAWKHTEDAERRAMHSSMMVSILLAEDDPQAALERGEAMLGAAINTLAPTNEAVRQAWPDAVQAALKLGRLEDVRRLVALLADRPPGLIAPYLATQLVRARALVDAAEGKNDAVEIGLGAAIDGFRELGYPYWRAVTQTELAEWSIEQQPMSESSGQLLHDSVQILERLRAAPALERAQDLVRSASGATRGRPSRG